MSTIQPPTPGEIKLCANKEQAFCQSPVKEVHILLSYPNSVLRRLTAIVTENFDWLDHTGRGS